MFVSFRLLFHHYYLSALITQKLLQEIESALAGQLSQEDEDDILAQLDELEKEVIDSPHKRITILMIRILKS